MPGEFKTREGGRQEEKWFHLAAASMSLPRVCGSEEHQTGSFLA